jgi:two-component system, NtrC family, sensor kinase
VSGGSPPAEDGRAVLPPPAPPSGLRIGLWPRLAALMAALAVVPAMLVGWQAFRDAVETASSTSEQTLRAEANLKAELLGRWVRDLAPIVHALPDLTRLETLSPESRSAFLRLVAQLLPPVQEVVLVDGTGALLAPPVLTATLDPDRLPLETGVPLAEVVAAPQRVHIGSAWPPTEGRSASFPLAVVANPAAEASARWVLMLRVLLDPGVDLLENATETHVVMLLDAGGTPLLGRPNPIVDPARLLPLLGNQATFRTDEGRGAGVQGVLTPVPSTPGWTIVVADASNAVRSPAIAVWEDLAPGIGVALVAALALAFVVAGSVSGPVERLRDAALLIAEGHPTVRATVSRGDEIGDLARAFDHMASRLEANRAEIAEQQSEIEAFNRELQARVDDRTRELREAQERLVRSGQLAAVAEISAGLAHELNNPLSAVLGLAQVLRSRHPDEGLLVDLEAQADRCREVVDALRRVQAPEEEGADVPVVPLADVVTQAIDLVVGVFRRRGVALVAGPIPADRRVRVDAVHGSRIVAQLLNALAAGLEGGATVEVRSTDSGRAPEVELLLLSDRPIGAHPDRKDDWLASGHGLWVARQLLERIGGRLEERVAAAPLRGVQWSVTLPGPEPLSAEGFAT